MKYAIILGDGMADYKIPSLAQKTPLQAARKPFIDALAKESELGLVSTVPPALSPGSDVANLSVLGYDPAEHYTGRSPLEAASIGIPLSGTDLTLRANFVTLSGEERYEDRSMEDYGAGEISTAEAAELIAFLKTALDDETTELFAGVSYRHCLVLHKRTEKAVFTPPHDIIGKKIGAYLPAGEDGGFYLGLMKRSAALLAEHPVNRRRVSEGKRPANSLWLWGAGTKPALPLFERKTGLKGGMISAVDLLKGIGKLAGMRVIDVPGATGNYDTDFIGKANACADALLSGLDFVYLHMEAPDECGHQGDVAHKIYAIEQIDGVVKCVCDRLSAAGEAFRLLLLPDHPTPVALRTHTRDAVPYLLYDSTRAAEGALSYDEDTAAATGRIFPSGRALFGHFIEKP